jgi:hypothetical protein
VVLRIDELKDNVIRDLLSYRAIIYQRELGYISSVLEVQNIYDQVPIETNSAAAPMISRSATSHSLDSISSASNSSITEESSSLDLPPSAAFVGNFFLGDS